MASRPWQKVVGPLAVMVAVGLGLTVKVVVATEGGHWPPLATVLVTV